MQAAPLLQVQRLSVCFGSGQAVDRASFEINAGETVCLVGESGSGKTVSALSILRLEQYSRARITSGEIVFDGQKLTQQPAAELDRLRGRRIGMIFQEPMTAFDPIFSIGEQIIETIRRHERVSRAAAKTRALALLERVQIPDPALRLTQIPQELSGGMRQRAMIAMALACRPQLLIADEPTTALDVTIQAQILQLLRELQRELGMAILLITHDLGVAAEMADRVVVMYAGRIAEQGPAAQLFAAPAHPYTQGLLRSAVPHTGQRAARLRTIAGAIPRLSELPRGCRFHPRCPSATNRCSVEEPTLTRTGDTEVACWHPGQSSAPTTRQSVLAPPLPAADVLIETVGLSKVFEVRRGLFATRQRIHALDSVSIAIRRGETFGLVGESGCGKSTLGRLLLQLETPSAGEIRFEGQPLTKRRNRRDMQMIFQDPYGSIDPRWRVADIVAEPLVAHERQRRSSLRTRIDELLDEVGLDRALQQRYAHELSGGQRQRVGIARAIALRPKLIVADEAVSALDLSVQAQIINLLSDLRERLGLTTLFIGHGLHVVRHLSDRIGVMYLGRLVEVASADSLFDRPYHHYTRALLRAIPVLDPARRRELQAPVGELPSPAAPPPGCHYHPRCPAATDRCRSERPELRLIEPGRLLACHHPAEHSRRNDNA